MPKTGTEAAQACPGFQPRADILKYSVRAIKTLAALRARMMDRADETPATMNSTFYSELLSKNDAPSPNVIDAWQFSVGLKRAGNKPIPLSAAVEDVISTDALQEIYDEMKVAGTLAEYGTQIAKIESLNPNELTITVNIMKVDGDKGD